MFQYQTEEMDNILQSEERKLVHDDDSEMLFNCVSGNGRKELSTYQWGYLLIVFSSLCGGLGNSLEPVSILTFVHISTLLMGIEFIFENIAVNSWGGIMNLLLVILIESFSFVLGFNGIFAYPKLTAVTILYSIGFGLLLWIVNAVVAIIPYLVYFQHYPKSFFNLFLFPVLLTVANCSVIGNIFSTFSSPGNSVLDYAPLRQVAMLFGIYGINFLFIFIATVCVYFFQRTEHIPLRKKKQMGVVIVLFGVSLFVVTGFCIQLPYFYQQHIPQITHKTLPVSCIFADTVDMYSTEYDVVWNSTLARIVAGDGIVLMSEEAFYLTSDEEETALLNKGLSLLAYTTNPQGVLLGITYEKALPNNEFVTNRFALLSSATATSNNNNTASILWNYQKAHPVPLIEDNVQPGSGELFYSHTAYGSLSGAICFDLDYPQYIAQIGRKNVDIVLQPSWTWNAIYSRHFEGNAIRAIENGFTLFRCSSDGESGIVDPYGKIIARATTGHGGEGDAYRIQVFSLPLQSGYTPMFPVLGFVVEYLFIVWGGYYYFHCLVDVESFLQSFSGYMI